MLKRELRSLTDNSLHPISFPEHSVNVDFLKGTNPRAGPPTYSDLISSLYFSGFSSMTEVIRERQTKNKNTEKNINTYEIVSTVEDIMKS